MKQVSEAFKQAIRKYGRQIDVIIEYTENGVSKMLNTDTLFSVTPIVRANLLKSVMKQLNFESYEKVPKDTWLHIRFGVLVDKALTVQDVHQMRVDRLNSTEVRLLQGFDYMDLGDYIVAEEPEYNADTLNYSHKCYDKMIYAMKDYEPLNVMYPIKIKDYLTSICNKIGIPIADVTFYNQDREIQNELYEGLGYKYRDVLDEIAEATGSIICINDNNQLEVKYLSETNEIINEDSLKDVNVSFSEKYGPINIIVLSRSAGTDNVYYPEELPENPVEIKIQDNQIMNWNDRSDYLPELYEALNGIEYYINDFKSTGITYLEVGDKYNIQIGENIYNCVLLNDEIDITQGLEEQIYTEMPEQSQTDYSKADKTDKKINQTNLTVDKQNQVIKGIITQIGDRSQKTTTITADIDGVNSRVEEIADLTDEISGIKTISLGNCIAGNLLELHIYGNNTVFDSLYPLDDLYPEDNIYPYGDSRIEVANFISSSEEPQFIKTYELGVTEVLRQNGDVCDEYILQDGKAKVIRRINKNGTIKTNEVIEDLGDFAIEVGNETNIITIQNYSARIKTKFAIKSTYTDIFTTKLEVSSSITQTANKIELDVDEKIEDTKTELNSNISQTAEEINLEVSKKVGDNEIISKINQSAEQIQIEANKISLARKKYQLNRRKCNNIKQ